MISKSLRRNLEWCAEDTDREFVLTSQDSKHTLLYMRQLERSLGAAQLAYRELSSVNRDGFGASELRAWRILNDIFFKNLFDVMPNDHLSTREKP